MQIERVLVVDDELLIREFLSETLNRLGCDVVMASSGEEAMEILNGDDKPFDLVMSDIKMGGATGLDVLSCAKERCPQTLVVLVTANATLDSALEAMHRGAFDYLTKPVAPNQLEVLLKKAGEYRALVEENKFYRKAALHKEDGFEDLVGRSSSMKDVFALVDKVASSSATVLINGESGTGKELIARAIHQRSDRKDKPFIRVNCAALPESLLESELFGHERGAFTGAIERRPGRFELAHTGTLLLDEISETSTKLQSKLLRVLQEREFERVGGAKTIKCDVRVLCTSNRDLEKAVEEGEFREDLFYRLNVVPIHLPPLRAREGDANLLLEYFLRRFADRHRRPLPTITQEVRELISNYEWPGNVRELENTVERAVLLNEGATLKTEAFGIGGVSFSRPVVSGASGSTAAPASSGTSGKSGLENINSLAEVEKRVILRTLEATKGNRTKAAGILGISVRTLYTKLREYQAIDVGKKSAKQPSNNGSGKEQHIVA